MAERLSIEPGKLFQTLKGTLMKADKHGREATDEEIAAFVIVANEYRLNPFIRQIYAFLAKGGGIVPVVSVDGWIAIINRQSQLDGIEFEDTLNEAGKLVAVSCSIHLKNRKFPVRVAEYLSECYRNTEPWNAMPFRMLRHKALIQAGRIAFGLTGIFDEDEGRDVVSMSATPEAPPLGRVNLGRINGQVSATQESKPEPVPAAAERQPGDEPSTF